MSSVPGCAEQLARFFPEVERVRVRAVLSPVRHSPETVSEAVLLEFASQEKAVFGTTLPLEFEDRVQLKNADGSGQLVAKVVAVQYHEGQKAVAIQFVSGQRAWVKKP